MTAVTIDDDKALMAALPEIRILHSTYPRPLIIVVLCLYLHPKPTLYPPGLCTRFLPNVKYWTDRNGETIVVPCDPLSGKG